MRRHWACAAALLLAGLTACGHGPSSATTEPAPSSATSKTSSSATSTPPRYQIDATVLESPTHGPQLCPYVAQSLPPQCDGTPIAGWDWASVDSEQAAGGTTWGEYHLVGTYDGTTFTLAEPPTTPRPPAPAPLPSYATPCAAPANGWDVVDPSKIALTDYEAFTAAAQSPSDYAGMWVDGSTNHDGVAGVPTKTVMNVAYTGDLDEHRARLAAFWGGPICVVSHSRSQADLQAIQSDIMGDRGAALGLQVGATWTDDVDNVVKVTAMVLDDGAPSRVDARYGPGVVVLDSYLQPAG